MQDIEGKMTQTDFDQLMAELFKLKLGQIKNGEDNKARIKEIEDILELNN